MPPAEGTALALLRANPTAVLRAGPQFPDSGGRSGARGGGRTQPPHWPRLRQWGRRTADEAVDGGARSSYRQSFRLEGPHSRPRPVKVLLLLSKAG